MDNTITTITFTDIVSAKHGIVLALEKALKKFASVKFYIIADVLLQREDKLTLVFYARNKNRNITNSNNINEIIDEEFAEIDNKIQEVCLSSSCLVFLDYETIRATIIKNTNMQGSSYIELPKYIRDKKAVINVKNKDDYCFVWSILSALYPAAIHTDRVSNYKPYFNKLKLDNLTFPMEIKNIHKFEVMNNISINVFGYSNETIDSAIVDENYFPLYNTKINSTTVVDLLYIESEELNENYKKEYHYAWIKDFKKLVHKSLNSNNNYEIICKKCMIGYTNYNVYNKHLIYCKTGEAQCIMPTINNILKFKNYSYKVKHHLAIYADFEAVIQNNKHIPSSVAFCSVGTINKFASFHNMDEFVKSIMDVVDDYDKKVQQYPKPLLTKKETEQYKSSKKCWLCNNPFTNELIKSRKGNLWQPNKKVRDHDHLTGKYLGPAHNKCNFQRKSNMFIPIYFHNLSNYDSHFMINLLNKFGEGNLKLIPHTEEKYISFSKFYNNYELRFLDSYRFIPESLNELSSNLLKKDKKLFKNLFKYTTKKEQDVIFWNEIITIDKTDTIIDSEWNVQFQKNKTSFEKPRIKGIYPYSFTDSFDKFKYNQVISRNDFKDDLNLKEISDQEYNQYLKVWNSIDNVNLGKYSDLYLKIDVLALADVFEEFRNTSLKAYELDPCYYYTTPGLTWDSGLKYTDIKLELLTDYRMLQMIEQGIRGGISGVTGNRYINVESKNYVTNPKIKETDPNQEWLLYLDANNLYGDSMSQQLPCSDFKWLTEEEILNLDSQIRNDKIKQDTGYILSVELIPPKSKKFENFPLAPETKKINIEALSEYSKNLKEPYVETEKLILDFKDKSNYTIHINNLILYYKLGAEFKIIEAISFKQSAWLKKYIDFNTKMRANALNDFEKNFFKLMNNAFFGKTMEAIRNRVDIILCDNWTQAKYHIKKPTFDYLKIFNKNLVALHMRKYKIVFNKPIYIGFCVLELSKHLMYDFYYNKLQNIFKDINLIYTDTDSFLLHIKDSNIYKIMKENDDLFDFSDYPKEHILNSNKNKKVLGKFKDECNGNIMIERIHLRSKMYSHRVYLQEKEDKKAKGIKSCVVKKKLSFDDYKNCIFKNKNTKHTFKIFKSNNHDIYTTEIEKKGLSAFDSKRYYINAIESIPFN